MCTPPANSGDASLPTKLSTSLSSSDEGRQHSAFSRGTLMVRTVPWRTLRIEIRPPRSRTRSLIPMTPTPIDLPLRKSIASMPIPLSPMTRCRQPVLPTRRTDRTGCTGVPVNVAQCFLCHPIDRCFHGCASFAAVGYVDFDLEPRALRKPLAKNPQSNCEAICWSMTADASQTKRYGFRSGSPPKYSCNPQQLRWIPIQQSPRAKRDKSEPE